MKKFKLSRSVITPEDLRAVVIEIEEYKQVVLHNSIKSRVNSRQLVELPRLSESAKELITDWHQDKDQINKTNLDQLVVELEHYIKKAPIARITLAATPNRGLKEQIVSWFRDNVNESLLIDFRSSSTILGGMVVNIGSHTYDWSFRRQLAYSQDKFKEVLRRV